MTLADEVHIGNFVEVKNSTLAAGSKANHLAYVGDATVGARVNIGAGTIVANYDGANKHRTVIGDDVHTGSNSVLVAPIQVGEGATVAAGSTVTVRVPAGKLTVARARQTTLDTWTRPVKKKSQGESRSAAPFLPCPSGRARGLLFLGMAVSRPDPGVLTSTPMRVAWALVALAVALLILWLLAEVVLIAFAAVLLAIVLRALARRIEAHTPLSSAWSLVVAVCVVGAVIVAFVLLLGTQISAQGAALIERLPQLIDKVAARLQIASVPELLRDGLPNMLGGELAGRVAGYTSRVVEIAALAVLVVVAAVYLAADPCMYRRGLLLLLPQRWRKEGARLLDNIGHALERWLIGQLLAMVLVGVLTAVGLWLIGVPAALALGFLAGVADFVPLVGPMLAAVPAVLVALAEGGNMVFWVIALYVLVQQIEGNLIVPLVQRRTVRLPPALSLFSILVFGVLFGPLGVLLAVPLAVVAFVTVRQLYLRRYLGEPVSVPGETAATRVQRG